MMNTSVHCFKVLHFFDKNTSGVNTSDVGVTRARSKTLVPRDRSAIECKIMTNQRPSDLACIAKVSDRVSQLAEGLHKPIIRKDEKQKVNSSLKDDIWGSDLANMQLISKYNKGFRFLLCVIDIYSKSAWVVPLKDKRGYYNY